MGDGFSIVFGYKPKQIMLLARITVYLKYPMISFLFYTSTILLFFHIFLLKFLDSAMETERFLSETSKAYSIIQGLKRVRH